MMKRTVMRPFRTEHAKAHRRLVGDCGGVCFADKFWRPTEDTWSNTISTVQKDNMISYRFI